MKLFIFFGTIALFFSNICSEKFQEYSEPELEEEDEGDRIIGGRKASPKEIPYQ